MVALLACGESTTQQNDVAKPAVAEQNKEVVRRLLMDCFSGGNLEVLDEIISPEFEFEYPNLSPGIEGLKALVKKNNECFEGWQFTMHDVLAVDDKVVVRWSASGIHEKSFLGESTTKKKVQLKGIAIYLLKNGMILKDWVEPDNLGFLTQLGVLAPIDFTADRK
jgi:predicted ester cyclase